MYSTTAASLRARCPKPNAKGAELPTAMGEPRRAGSGGQRRGLGAAADAGSGGRHRLLARLVGAAAAEPAPAPGAQPSHKPGRRGPPRCGRGRSSGPWPRTAGGAGRAGAPVPRPFCRFAHAPALLPARRIAPALVGFGAGPEKLDFAATRPLAAAARRPHNAAALLRAVSLGGLPPGLPKTGPCTKRAAQRRTARCWTSRPNAAHPGRW